MRIGARHRLHELGWTDDSRLCIDFDGRRPMFRIHAEADKGHKHRLLPMTPDFAAFLDSVPDDERSGFVFDPLPWRTGRADRIHAVTASATIASIGRKAGVKVSNSADRVKFASAHDLRRSFGFRWSSRLMPTALMQLMRHEDMQATLTFYVGKNADDAADVVWAAFGGTETGKSDPEPASRTEPA
jgi:integrase